MPAGQFSQDPHVEGRLNVFKTPSFLANFDLASTLETYTFCDGPVTIFKWGFDLKCLGLSLEMVYAILEQTIGPIPSRV